MLGICKIYLTYMNMINYRQIKPYIEYKYQNLIFKPNAPFDIRCLTKNVPFLINTLLFT